MDCRICSQPIEWYEDRVTRDLMEKSLGRVVPCLVHPICSHQLGLQALIKELHAEHNKRTGPYSQ